MATITFKIKNNSIYYRYRNGRSLDVTRKLPFLVNQSDWSATKQQFKTNIAVNNQLNRYKTYLIEQNNLSYSKKESISLDWIKMKQDQYFNPTQKSIENKEIYFSNYIQHFINIKKPREYKFIALKRYVKQLDDVEISNINHEWLEMFVKSRLSNRYAESTINKDIQHIKRILKYAEINEITINRTVYEYKAPSPNTITTFLDNEELNMIFKLETNDVRLENVKKLFLVGCTTGLRVSDLMKIKNHRIKNGFIEVQNTVKTKQALIIPIDSRVKLFIPDLKPISHQKFNLYLKELCKLAGIDKPIKGYIQSKQNKRMLGIYPKYKLITSHTMRRSFATNLYGNVPTVVIMAITGHTTEKSFLTYIKRPQRDFAEQLKKYYLEQSK